MTKEHLIDTYGDGALHDRQRLLGRLARPAAGGERLPGPLPGHHAGVQLHRRVVVGDAVRRLPGAAPLLREPGGWAPGRRVGADQIAAVEGHPEPGERGDLHHRDPVERRPEPQLPGRAGRPGLRREDEPQGRALLAAGLHGQRVRPAAAGRLRGRPFDNVGIQYGLKALEAGTITPAQFVDLNAEARRLRHRLQPDAGAHRRPTARRSTASTAAARSTRPTTSTRSRSSTCAAPTRARSTTSTAPTRCGRGSTASTARTPTRSCGAARCRCSATPTTRTSRSSRWTRGSR